MVSPAVTYDDLWIKNHSARLRYTGVLARAHEFDFANASKLEVGTRMTHIVDMRFQYSRPLAFGAVNYGLDAIYTGSSFGTFAVENGEADFESGRNVLTGRGFVGFEANSRYGDGHFEIGMTDTNQLSFSGALSIRF